MDGAKAKAKRNIRRWHEGCPSIIPPESGIEQLEGSKGVSPTSDIRPLDMPCPSCEYMRTDHPLCEIR